MKAVIVLCSALKAKQRTVHFFLENKMESHYVAAGLARRPPPSLLELFGASPLKPMLT